MIKITGKDSQTLLRSFDMKRTVAGGRKVTHDYTHFFTCKQAEFTTDGAILRTMFEHNDIKVIKRTIAILKLDCEVERI